MVLASEQRCGGNEAAIRALHLSHRICTLFNCQSAMDSEEDGYEAPVRLSSLADPMSAWAAAEDLNRQISAFQCVPLGGSSELVELWRSNLRYASMDLHQSPFLHASSLAWHSVGHAAAATRRCACTAQIPTHPHRSIHRHTAITTTNPRYMLRIYNNQHHSTPTTQKQTFIQPNQPTPALPTATG